MSDSKYAAIEQMQGGYVVHGADDNRQIVTSLNKAISILKKEFTGETEVQESAPDAKVFLTEG